MKAYIVSLKYNSDVGNEIVFANNSKEAKKEALHTAVAEFTECYIDLEVRRYQKFDGMQDLSRMELSKNQWRDNWQWFDYSDVPNCEDATDEEFYEWYKKYFEE